MATVRIKSIKPVGDDGPDMSLAFIAGPADLEYRDATYQEELHAIDAKLKTLSSRVQARADFQKSGTGGSWLTGDFLVHLSALGTPLGALFGAWVTAKLGRKVRVKIGDIEVEAVTTKEVEHLLQRAKELKREIDKTP